MRIVKFALLGVLVFGLAFSATFMFRDPAVDMSKYEDVIPEYKAKVRELLTVTAILRSPVYTLRHGRALDRLEALAEEGVVPEAVDTAFVYYAQPEVFYCTRPDRACPKSQDNFSEERTEKAFYWARKMEGLKMATALSYLLRDARFAPVATEQDRIALMFVTEEENRTALEVAVALAFHHLDNRYFGNNMMDEALLWLNRARELEQKL